MECPPAYSVPPPKVSLQEIDGAACTADAVPSQSTERPLHLPWFTPTLYDLHSILLIVIYRRFYHFLFGASHGSVHLSPLTIRYRASSLPLLHLEGNERSGGTFQHAAYLAFNAFTQFFIIGLSVTSETVYSVYSYSYISTLCMACSLDCTNCGLLWF